MSEIDSEIRSSLNKKIISLEGESFFNCCDFIEAEIIQLIQKQIENYLEQQQNNIYCLPGNSFMLNGEHFVFSCSSIAAKPNFLSIAILSSVSKKDNFKKDTVSIDSVGRYTKVELKLCEPFHAFCEDFGNIIKNTLLVSYRWLHEYIESNLDCQYRDTVTKLYSHLRSLFEDKVSSQILLHAIVESKGIYVFDQIKRRELMGELNKRKLKTPYSPIELLSEYTSSVVDYDKIWSKIAISENQTIEADLIKSKYNESKIVIAELSTYTSGRSVIQPLVREGKSLLVACYSVELRPNVEDILTVESRKFKDILDFEASSIKKILGKIDKEYKYIGWNKPVELVGSFIRGLSGISGP